MACFLVPATEAIVATVIRKAMEAKGVECVSKMPEAHFRRLWLHFCVDFP